MSLTATLKGRPRIFTMRLVPTMCSGGPAQAAWQAVRLDVALGIYTYMACRSSTTSWGGWLSLCVTKYPYVVPMAPLSMRYSHLLLQACLKPMQPAV